MKKTDSVPSFLGSTFSGICGADARAAEVKQCILEGMEVTAANHPLVQSRLIILRDACTNNADFRVALTDLDTILIYGASRELPVDDFDVQTPVTTAPSYRLQDPSIIIPIIRTGLGMIDLSLSMIPDVQVGFTGLARNEETHELVPYLEALPEDLSGCTVFLVDPMLAVGGSLLHALKLLVGHGADNIMAVCVISAQQGVDALRESGLPVHLVTTVVSPILNEDTYIVLGLGDTGDRFYGPRNIDL